MWASGSDLMRRLISCQRDLKRCIHVISYLIAELLKRGYSKDIPKRFVYKNVFEFGAVEDYAACSKSN